MSTCSRPRTAWWLSALPWTLCLFVALPNSRFAGGSEPVMPDESGNVSATSIAGILGMPPDAITRALPVRVEGIVTFRNDAASNDRIALVVQDGAVGLWVLAPKTTALARGEGFERFDDDVRPGCRVIVEGVTDPGAYSPRVFASEIRPLGEEPLPAVLSPEESGIFRGAGNAVRTRFTGIVQIARRDKGAWNLTMESDGRRVTVRSAHPPDGGRADHLVDTMVRATGVTASVRNSRGQFLAPVLLINGFEDLQRIEEAPSPAFDSPFVPLEQIGRFGSISLDGHRFQTEGVVTRSQPTRYLYLQARSVGVRVETGDREAYRPGDRVRVAGFIDSGRQVRGMTGAVTKRIAAGPAPVPTPIRPDELSTAMVAAAGRSRSSMGNDHAGCLVVFQATITDSGQTRDGGLLRLACGDSILEAALLPDAFRTASLIPRGSEISVTGILQYDVARQSEEQVDGRLNPFERFTLLVHSPDDVVLLRAAPWWTPLRLSLALAAVLAVLAAALAWAWSLRRQVARQAAAIAKEMRARREAAVEFQATLRERTRLAANLHDTLLQSMAGIGFQLEACQMSARRPAAGFPGSESAEHLDVARRMIDHAVGDIRGSVWALRSTAVHGQSLTEAIDGLLARIGTGHRARISARSSGEPFALPDFVTGNLLLIVQEAILNSLHHGDPNLVDVLVAFNPSAGTVEVTIHDDGQGFAVGSQPGPADGHFGLQGMRERAERLGGSLELESAPGGTTTVRCRVCCRAYDPEIEHDAVDRSAALADRPIAASGSGVVV
jgi:signal transduction histidine kinase